MTEKDKKAAIGMKKEGLSYGEIAFALNVSRSTVSSFLKRNDSGVTSYCKECGSKLKRSKTGRKKEFCSGKCRRRYWIKKTNKTVSICQFCKKEFTQPYGKKRRYCSRDCYLKSAMKERAIC